MMLQINQVNSEVIMGIFSRVTASVKDLLNKKQYDKANDKAKTIAVLMEAEMAGKTPAIGPYVEHPLHKARLQQYIKNVEDYNNLPPALQTAKGTIAFGDSLIDIPRGEFCSINEKLNFAISGSWANHMEQMAVDIFHLLFQKGMTIKNVVVGTLGGNPLLSYQDVDATVKISYDCLDKLRRIFPFAKIIVYGLPPVYNAYATRNSIKFESNMFEWVNKDDNAVFVPLFSKFGQGLFNLTPNVVTSSDGVHLTHNGVVILDNLFDKAKSAKPKSIID